MVFLILEKIVGNGILTRLERIYTCVYVSHQLENHLDKELENSLH